MNANIKSSFMKTNDDLLNDIKELQERYSKLKTEYELLQKEMSTLKGQLGTNLQDPKDCQEFQDPSCFEMTFRYVISGLSSLQDSEYQYSPLYFIQKVPCKLKVGSYIAAVYADHIERDIAVFLCFANWPDHASHGCYVEVTFALLNQNDKCLSHIMELQKEFETGSKECELGFPSFLSWNSLMIGGNYIKNDSIVIEVHVAISAFIKHIGMDTSMTELCEKGINVHTNSTLMKTTHRNSGPEGLEGMYIEDRALSLLNTGLGSDCTFLVGKEGQQKKLYASRILLARASPVFESMFYGNFQDQTIIEVPDIEPSVFLLMLKAIYGCKWTFDCCSCQLYYAAQKYMLMDVMDRCLENIWPVNVDDLWTSLELATAFHLDYFLEAVMKIVRGNTTAVLESKHFLSISQASLIAILKQYCLNINSEIEVFDAAMRWAKARCAEEGLSENGSNLRSQLGEAVYYIRFLAMSESEFSRRPYESGILTSEEALTILRRIICKVDEPTLYTLCPLKYARTCASLNAKSCSQRASSSNPVTFKPNV